MSIRKWLVTLYFRHGEDSLWNWVEYHSLFISLAVPSLTALSLAYVVEADSQVLEAILTFVWILQVYNWAVSYHIGKRGHWGVTVHICDSFVYLRLSKYLLTRIINTLHTEISVRSLSLLYFFLKIINSLRTSYNMYWSYSLLSPDSP